MGKDPIHMAQTVLHYDVNLATRPLRLDLDYGLTIDSIMLGGWVGLQCEDWWWRRGRPPNGSAMRGLNSYLAMLIAPQADSSTCSGAGC